MYKLMIVDDEPLFTDGLAECLRDMRNPEWEIFKAYHAEEALRRLERTPVDILLLDIRMPGMNGLELHREVKGRWPHCKVLYLTGHDEFGYIQEAFRQGGVEYILKTEGDEVIVAALQKAAKELEEELRRNQWAVEAIERLHQAKSSLRKSLFLEVIGGDLEDDGEQLAAQFKDLDITLDPQAPVLIVLGKVDQWPDGVKKMDRSMFLFAVQNIAQDLLSPSLNLFSVDTDRSHIIWFIQPANAAAFRDRTVIFAEGMMGQVQDKCKALLKLNVSFVMSDRLVSWRKADVQFYRLKNLMFRHFGLQQQLFLIDRPRSEHSAAPDEAGYAKQIAQLKFALEHNQREAFRNGLMQLANPPGGDRPNSTWDRAQLYFSLVALAMETIGQLAMKEEVEARFDLSGLFKEVYSMTWDEFLCLYGELIELVFDCRSREWERQGMNLVLRIRSFIARDLQADLSLTRIAEHVSYHPAYLSRLYKQLSGKSLSDDIAEMRLKRAEQLLTDKQMKIHEIGKSIGFDSPRYFTKFFKAHTGYTPQEFRERTGNSETVDLDRKS